jgi:peptidoglycan/xylan/chitin deacetylase (PgdA/CDA1 family)
MREDCDSRSEAISAAPDRAAARQPRPMNSLVMRLSGPLLARGVGLAMQMAGTVLAVQTMPVAEVAIYFSVVAAANVISSGSDFGFCQYAFRYLNRGVALHRVFGAALTVNLGGIVICLVLATGTAALMHVPALLLIGAVAASSLHKLTSLNASVLLVRDRVSLAVAIAGLQPTLFVLLILTYAALVPDARSGRGTIGIVGAIYLASFALAFPIAVALCRNGREWRAALRLPRRLRRRQLRALLRTIRRSILLAVEQNLTLLWEGFLVLWFQAAGYSYETAVLGVLQRILGVSRAAIGVSLQAQLTYYYNARVSSSYLITLAKQGLVIGCAVAVVAVAGGWAIELGRPLFTHLEIAGMLSALSRYWLLLGVICMAEYLLHHFSSFALGLNRKFIRVAAPIVGLAVLLGAGLGALWFEQRSPLSYALLSYAGSLSAGAAVLLILLAGLQTRRPVSGSRLGPPRLRPHRHRSREPNEPPHYKRRVHLAIRRFHEIFLKRELSERLAIYFHEVSTADYDKFSDLIAFFKADGYVFVDAAGLCALGGGKRIFISFDDNYGSWTKLLNLFDGCGIGVTFFVNTVPFRDVATTPAINDYFDRIKHYGERISLSTTELRELAAAGHRIGCHSHSHLDLTKLARSRWGSEIDRSKSALEEIIGHQVVDFAYPFGMRRHFSRPLRTYCLGLGFHTISNSIPGRQCAPHRLDSINRGMWALEENFDFNINNLQMDGRVFEKITGRSPIA